MPIPNTELIPVAAQPIATHDDPEALLRFAVERGSDVATIERLMNVRRELRAEKAKREFDSAMAAFQSECPVIFKQKGVPDLSGRIAYKYAPLEDIVQTIRPALLTHGFSFTLDTDVESKDGWVIALCHVTHRGGHKETSTVKMPLSAGTKLMNTTQIYAAALTVALRRVVCNAFGIVPAGEDMDGRTSQPKPKGPSSVAADLDVKEAARELWGLLKNVRGTEKPPNWKVANSWLSVEAILAEGEEAPHLSPERFTEVIAATKTTLAQ